MFDSRTRRQFLRTALSAGTIPGLAAQTAASHIEVYNSFVSALPEIVLFPFDDYAIPFTKSLTLSLVAGSKGPNDYMEGTSYDPDHPGGPVVRTGEHGTPDSIEVICPTVIRIGDEYRMWYLCKGDSEPQALPNLYSAGRKEDRHRHVGYATSEDGIHWKKPRLGIVPYAGSKDNNLVNFPGDITAIMHDTEDPDPTKRFKAVYQVGYLRLGVAYSADGLRWNPSPNNPVGGGIELEYAPIKFNGCYYVNGQGGPTALNKTIPNPVPNAGKRDLITYASYDFEHWTKAAVLSLRREPMPPRAIPDFEMHRGEQVHEGASLWNRGNVFIGFYGQYHNVTNDRRFATMDIGLVVSSDVMHMREPVPDFKMVRWAEEAETDGQSGVRLMPGGGTENIGDRTIHWYSTWEYPARGGVRVATWQRDRLGYFSAVPRQLFTGPAVMNVDVDPHMISSAFILGRPGRKVYINADGLSENSFLSVELLDLQFRPVPGYSGDHSARVSTSSLRTPLAWRSETALQAFNHPVRLRINWSGIRPEDARLYAVYIG